MYFEYIWLLGLVILLPAYIYLRQRQIKTRLIKYPPLQYHPRRFKKSFNLFIYLGFETLLVFLCILAVAGPYSENESTQINDKGLDIAFLLDVSASMQAGDFKPNRLEALKKLTNEFINRSGSNRISIMVFAKDVFNQSPLTSDHSVLQFLTEGIAYEMINHATSGGTAIGDALITGTDSLLQFRQPNRDQVIILITDGESQEGIDPLIGARYVKDKNIRLYVIGMGKKTPVKVYINGQPFINQRGEHLSTVLNDEQLKKVAQTAKGKYYWAKNENVLSRIFKQLSHLEKTPIEIQTIKQRHSKVSIVASFILIFFIGWLAYTHMFIRRPLR